MSPSSTAQLHVISLANVPRTRATQCGQSIHLSQCMRCRDDAESDHKTRKRKTTGACQRTRARQALGQIHHNACLKHSNSSTDQNSLTDQLLCSWNIMATAKGQAIKQLAPHIQIPTRSVHRMFRIRRHGSFSCCVLHIHALLLAEQSLGESVTAISPSNLQIPGLFECREVRLPIECVPEISLCLVPALNRGSLR